MPPLQAISKCGSYVEALVFPEIPYDFYGSNSSLEHETYF
jgi:hypothetical protein